MSHEIVYTCDVCGRVIPDEQARFLGDGPRMVEVKLSSLSYQFEPERFQFHPECAGPVLQSVRDAIRLQGESHE
jgi:hypothetical protein